MKKNLKITKNLEQKSILKKAMESSENVDLYKSIFGGLSTSENSAADTCYVTAVTGASAAYNRVPDQFLLATKPIGKL